MTPRLLAVACAGLALALPASAQLSVWTVDPAGGGDFTSLQAAVDAAGAGDLVLVHGGVIENVVVDKGLTLAGAEGGFGIVKPTGSDQPALRVRDLPADQTVVLSDLTVFVGDAGAPAALLVDNCAGAVWLQDVLVDSYGSQAAWIHDARSLVVTGSLLQTNLVPAALDGTPQSAPGALVEEESRLMAYDAEFAGSHGTLVGAGNPDPLLPADGGAGLQLVDATAFLHASELSGSSGSSLLVGGCVQGGDGGPGAVLRSMAGGDGASLSMWGAGSLINGGFGGPFDPGCAAAPAHGETVDAGPGTSYSVGANGPRRSFHAPPLVPAGEFLELTFDGEPGDFVLLLAAAGGAPALPIGAAAFLHLDPGSLVFLVGFPLLSDELQVPVFMPPLPVGVDGLVLPLQVVFKDAEGFRHASPPRMLVAVSP